MGIYCFLGLLASGGTCFIIGYALGRVTAREYTVVHYDLPGEGIVLGPAPLGIPGGRNMTVHELRVELARFDSDLKVFFFDNEYDIAVSVDQVEVEMGRMEILFGRTFSPNNCVTRHPEKDFAVIIRG
jgi:hypothetical protein